MPVKFLEHYRHHPVDEWQRENWPICEWTKVTYSPRGFEDTGEHFWWKRSNCARSGHPIWRAGKRTGSVQPSTSSGPNSMELGNFKMRLAQRLSVHSVTKTCETGHVSLVTKRGTDSGSTSVRQTISRSTTAPMHKTFPLRWARINKRSSQTFFWRIFYRSTTRPPDYQNRQRSRYKTPYPFTRNLEWKKSPCFKRWWVQHNVLVRSFVEKPRDKLNIRQEAVIASHSDKSNSGTSEEIVIEAPIKLGELV